MAFNSASSLTDQDQEDELTRCEWLRELAGIPRPLRLLLNRRDIYAIPELVADTLEHAPALGVLVDSCRQLRSSSPNGSYRSVEELAVERMRLAEALHMISSRVCQELALCWRMAAGTTVAPPHVRQEIGQQIVQLFGAYSSGTTIGFIGLGTACDLALAVASWSVVCHGGGTAIGGQTTGTWLLYQTRDTARLLRDAGEIHPGSHLHEINAGLRAEVEFLKDRLVELSMDNSSQTNTNDESQGRQTAPKQSRTLH
ncbi:hypothetical protein MBRA_06288 [Methylobacterium brachiatum]|nr:hypothetical protein MBRA_06288 [Methylobacterium brachiatum]